LWFKFAVSQLLLFQDPRPLVERLGANFFRGVPESAGVYVMRDLQETVLYVGKGKNLRKRLCSYRVANPDRLRKRQLRLLRAVSRIELEFCADERSALAREAELLRVLKPRFNRAGTWPIPGQFIAWNVNDTGLVFALRREVPPGWYFYGPARGGALALRASMIRLAWSAIHQQDCTRLPEGWWKGVRRAELTIPGLFKPRELLKETAAQLAAACMGKKEEFAAWLRERTANVNHPFASQPEKRICNVSNFYLDRKPEVFP
jgi:predicted GIY-YIG superfamily endonuclease